jgi:hypothetical protein
MQTQSSLMKCGTLCFLTLMVSGLGSSAFAGGNCNCFRGSGGWGRGSGSLYVNNSYYYDARDTRLYSAQKYNVPVTVPVAPVVRTYNYGWGIPSARLSPIGGYMAWYPETPYTQYGGRLPGGLFPTAYQPTDTTQAGYYYSYVPTWQPR